MSIGPRRGIRNHLICTALLVAVALFASVIAAMAQDQDEDPPGRVARLGYMEGSVSLQPAGETDWVAAVQNRPLTIGDKIWSDQNSRAELQLGSAAIRLSANTGASFLNLDDQTVQLQLSSGVINVRVRSLVPNGDFEIDTPNLAFTIAQPGSYRFEASEDGTNTVITVRAGDGQATGNGQTYTLHAGQMGTFSGTNSLNADVESIGQPDGFDTWADGRDRLYADSRSAQYLSHDVVGFEDLDANGNWRDDPNYGHVWFPNQVAAGWAPYREGHWDWIDPWGFTWVDDSPWGYAPFHYGRWAYISGQWGWVPGPPAEVPVYAPALVAFVGGPGGFGGNVGWFPLGPREVYVPSYQVSQAYMSRVNISNTNVSTTTVTNIYQTTVVNKTTVTNVNYVNRNVQGAVTVVPQRTFASAQPVARSVVAVNQRELAAAPVSARAAVNPTRESVLGAKAATANHVTAPPAAIMNRTVVAKKTPPPAPAPFAARQRAMAAHPGEPLPRRELASLHVPAAVHPAVKVAPPGKPATPTTGHPAGQPNAAKPETNRPGAAPENNRPEANRPPEANKPAAQPNERPGPNRPEAAPPNNRPAAPENNRPEANRPPETNKPAAQPNERPAPNRPEAAPPNNRPAPPENNRPEANRPPETNKPAAQPNERPAPNRPEAAPPNNRPTAPENNRPEANRPPEANKPAAQPNERPAPNRSAQPNRPENKTAPSERPEPNRAATPAKPANRPEQPAAKPQKPGEPPAQREAPTAKAPNKPTEQQKTMEQKKQEEEKKREEEQKPHSE